MGGCDNFTKLMKIPDSNVIVDFHIYDISGHDMYKSLHKRIIEGTDYIMAVYDVTSRESFKVALSWVKKCREICKDTSIKGVLVGAKSDLKEWAKVPGPE